MPSLYTPENTPVIFVGTRGDVKVRDENGQEIKLKKGDKIPAGASISVGPQGGKIVFRRAEQTLKFENSGEVSLTNALMQASEATQADIDTTTEQPLTAAQVTTTPETTVQPQPKQQPLSHPTTRAEATPAPTPARQGISEAPEVVKADHGEEPQQTATEIVAQMAENVVQNSTRAAAPVARVQTQAPRVAEDIGAVEKIQPTPPGRPEEPSVTPEDQPGPQPPEAPVMASFSPDTGIAVNAGGNKPSESFTITTDNKPPILTFDDLVCDADYPFAVFSKSATVSGKATPLLTFQLKAGNATTDVTADKDGCWSHKLTGLEDGLVSLSASARSAAGISISQTAQMLVRTAPYDIRIAADTGPGNTDLYTRADFIHIMAHGQPGAKLAFRVGEGDELLADFDNDGLAVHQMGLGGDGNYPLQFRTIYKGGEGESATVSKVITLDQTKAVITPDDHGTSFNTPVLKFSGTSNEDNITVSLKLVNKKTREVVFEGTADVAGGKYNIDATVPADGTYTATLVAVDLAGNKTRPEPVDILVDQSMPETPTDIAVENLVQVNELDYLGSQTFTVTGKAAPGCSVFLNIDGRQTPAIQVSDGGTWSITYTTTASDQVTFTAQARNHANTLSDESAPVDFRLDLVRPTIETMVDPEQPVEIEVFNPVNVTVKLSEPVSITGVPRCQLQADETRLEAPFNSDLSPKTSAGTYTELVFSVLAPEGIRADNLKVPANPILVDDENTIRDVAGHDLDSAAFTGATLNNFHFNTVVILNPPKILRISPDTGAIPDDGVTNSRQFLIIGTADKDETVYVMVNGEKYDEVKATGTGQWQIPPRVTTDEFNAVITTEVRFGDKKAGSAPFEVTFDAIAPLVTGITASTSDAFLPAEARLPVTIQLDSDIYLKGPLSLELGLDSGKVLVPVKVSASGSARQLEAELTVAENALSETGLKPVQLVPGPGSSVTDLAGNPVNTDLSGLPAISQNIDAIPPHIQVNLPSGWVTGNKTPIIPVVTKPYARVTLTVDGKNYEQTTDVKGHCNIRVTDPLAAGSKDYSLVAVDRANVATSPLQGSFTVNLDRPSLTVDGLKTCDTDYCINIRKPTFSGTTDSNVKVVVKVDGEEIGFSTDENWQVPCMADLSPGSHPVEVIATSTATNLSTSSELFLDVDFKKTVVELKTHHIDLSKPVVTVSCDEAVSDDNIKFFSKPKADAQTEFTACEITQIARDGNDLSLILADRALQDAEYLAYVKVVDPHGNSGQSGEAGIVVDSSAPAISIETPEYLNTRDVVIEGSSSAPGQTVTVRVNGQVVSSDVLVDDSGHWSYTSKGHSKTETLDIEVAVTGLNNIPATGSKQVHLKFSNPKIEVTSEALSNDPYPTFAGTASEGEQGTTVTIKTPVETLTAEVKENLGWQVTASKKYSEGQQTANITARDKYGNEAEPVPFSYELDFSAPAISVPDNLVSMASSYTLSGTCDDDQGTIVYKVDGGTESEVPLSDSVWEIELTGLTRGEHTVELHTKDAPGNTGTPISRPLTVEFKAPDLQLTTEPGLTNNQTPVWAGQTVIGAKVTVSVNGEAPQDVPVDASGHFSFSPQQPLPESDQPHSVEFVSTCAGYELPAQQTSSVTADKTGPVIEVTEGLSIEGTETTLRGTCSQDTKSITVKTLTAGGSEVASFNAVVNGAGGTWECQATGITSQTRSVLVSSEDTLGNKGADVPQALVFAQELTLNLTQEPERTAPDQPEWKGNARVANASITVTIGSLGSGTTTTDGNGDFVFRPDFKLTEVDGGHAVTVKAEAEGYKPVEVTGKTVTLDNTSPVITLEVFSPTASTAALKGTSSEAKGKVYIRVGEDGEVQIAIVDDFKWELSLTNLSEGSQTLYYKGEDDLGNVAADFQSRDFEVAYAQPDLSLTDTPAVQSYDTTPTWKGQFVAGGQLTIAIDRLDPVPVPLKDDGTFDFTLAGELTAGVHTAAVSGSAPGFDGIATTSINFEVLPGKDPVLEPDLAIDKGLVTDKSSTVLVGRFPEQTGKLKLKITGEHIDSTMYIPVRDGTWTLDLGDLVRQTADITVTALDQGRKPMKGFEPLSYKLQVAGDAPDSNIIGVDGHNSVSAYGSALVLPDDEAPDWSAHVLTSHEKPTHAYLVVQNKNGVYRKAYTPKDGIPFQEDHSFDINRSTETRNNSDLKFDYESESLVHAQWQFKELREKPGGGFAIAFQYFEPAYILKGAPSVHYNFDHRVAGQFNSLTLPYHIPAADSAPYTPGAMGGGVDLSAGALEIPHFKDLFRSSFSLCFNLKTKEQAASADSPLPALAGYSDASEARSYAVGVINEKGQIGVQVGSNKLFSNTIVNNNQWHHVCIIRKAGDDGPGSTYTIVVDGKADNSCYFTHDLTEGQMVSAYNLTSIGGTIHSDGRAMDAFDGKLDNLKAFSYALNDADTARQATLLAHVNWHCTDDHCPYKGDHPAGLMINELLGNQLPAENATLYFQIKELNSHKLVTDFTVTLKGQLVYPVDIDEPIYKLEGITLEDLLDLSIKPDNPHQPYGPSVNDMYGFQLNVDTKQDELATNPDAVVRFDRGEIPFGSGISFGIGKEQSGIEPYQDKYLTQQDCFLPTGQGTNIHYYDGTKGTISLEGLQEMRAFFEDARHQDDTLAQLLQKTDDNHYDLKHPCTLQEGEQCSDPLLYIDTVADNRQILLTLDDHLVNVPV